MHRRPRFASSTVTLAAVALLGGGLACAQVSGISGPNGSSSIAMWFLGPGVISCCPGLTDLYWAQSTATITNNSGDPNPTVQWFTDTPGSVQFLRSEQ